MVSPPRTCPHCGNRTTHYGSCGCPRASIEWIRNERVKLQERLVRLDKLEADASAKLTATA